MSKNSLVKSLLFILLLTSLSAICFGQRVKLRSNINPTCTSNQGTSLKFSDIYADGNIAVMGSYGCKGVFIFNVSNPDIPTLSNWYNPAPNQHFLEAIVIGNRGYFGSGGATSPGSGSGGDGVHIVDLTNPTAPVLLGKVNATTGGGFSNIHEMMVWDQDGARYLLINNNGGSTPMRIIDVTNPAVPVLKWEFSAANGGWTHAMHIRGTRLYLSVFSSSNPRIEILSIANLAAQAPSVLGSVNVGLSSNHSAWTSEDGNYLYSAREISNSDATNPGDIRVYNVSNPASPMLVNSLSMAGLGIVAVTPHNPVVMGNKLYVAWYQAGTLVFDITDPVNPRRIGQYDTWPAQFSEDDLRKVQVEKSKFGEDDVICGVDRLSNQQIAGYNGNWAVFPFLGENKVLLGDLATGLYVVNVVPMNQVSDFDGDGKTDFSVFRSSNGNWDIEQSSTGAPSTINFGLSGDIITPGDFDGDGINDLAIYRPSTGTWWIRRTTNPGNFLAVQFGLSADIPMAADYDADGKTDIAVWRPSTGVWYIMQSTLGIRITQWGNSADKPVRGDFEGDGKADIAVWRPSNGVWYILQSSSSTPMYGAWGANGDKPLAADFDGNGMSDFAVYRPSNGVWYILDPSTGVFRGYAWGIAEDIPIPSDFDGDGRSDVTVFRPSANAWYRINSSNGANDVRVFGQAGDKPSPSSVQPQ